MHSISHNIRVFKENPFKAYPIEEARKTVENIYKTQRDSTTFILNTKKPNVVMVVLESWSADLIESLGGEAGITPEFRNLEKNGLLFNNIYSSGMRSQQGMASLFGGFPAHPIESITYAAEKYTQLPSLSELFNREGYNTSYYFGGQLIYGNIKGYIYANKIQKIVDVNDLDPDMPKGKLGYFR